MTRRQTLAELAAIDRKLDKLRPVVEAARADAQRHAETLGPEERAGLPMLTAEASDRPARIALAVRSFGAPAALSDEMNARGLTLRQAHALLSKAAGSARTVSAAGVAQIRVALTAMDQAARATTARANADRTTAVADLLHRYGLVHTLAGARLAASAHPIDVLHGLLHTRANAFGRLDHAAQAGLVRDLALTTQPKKEPRK